MNTLFAAENAKGRERLISLVDRLTDAQLAQPLYAEGWTVAVALAHLAFWDERRRVLLRKWKQSGVTQSPMDADAVNDAMIPLLRLIPPRQAANLAVSTAKALDTELQDIPPELVKEIKESADIHALDRSVHRKMHLDDIEALLKPGK